MQNITSRSRAVAQGHARALAAGERHQQIDEPCHKVDDAKTADAATYEIIGHYRVDDWPRDREVVALPESGPRQDDEQKTDLEEERDAGEPANQI
jgi:hypothetical protein